MQRQQQEERKQRKRKAAEPGAGAGAPGSKPAWEGAHPWRPFDREKDMQGTQKLSSADVMKKAGSLTGRFAAG